jgi:Ca2+-binding RTX toxin-like protein
LKYQIREKALVFNLKQISIITSILLFIVIPTGIAHGSCGELSSGCNVTGTDGNDNLQGTSLEDLIYGHEGKDKIQAGYGDDYIVPGNGADEINAGDGNDVIFLQDDNEVDIVICGDGNDVILVENVDLEIDPDDILVGCEQVATLRVSHDGE